MSAATRRLFCFGLGYTARALARALKAEGWAVAGPDNREDFSHDF
ncbi:MAG: hypothetical protein V3R74_08580 [Alphaproteobacteria bacterium]